MSVELTKLTEDDIKNVRLYAQNLASVDELASVLGADVDELSLEIETNQTPLAKLWNSQKAATRLSIRANVIAQLEDPTKLSKSSIKDMLALLVYLDGLEGYNQAVKSEGTSVEVTLI